MSLTRSQTELLEVIQSEIEDKDDGTAHNLFQIADKADMDYSWAHRNLQSLILTGMVRVRRKGCLEIKILSSVPQRGSGSGVLGDENGLR